MNRTGFLIALLLVISFTFSQHRYAPQQRPYLAEYSKYDRVYNEAEKLSLSGRYTDETEKQEARLNQEALKGFKNILPAIEAAGDDSLAFYCYFKTGTLEHYFDSLDAASIAYAKALQLYTKNPSFPDSIIFKLCLYTGGILYGRNQFDSALTNYQKAETIANRHGETLPERNRLYNTLGAMYYETGNYTQAKNYFEKSASLLKESEPSYTDLLVNYKINLAATCTRLEQYEQASRIYESILPYGINTNEILHNTGSIWYKMSDSRKAIRCFKQVNYTGNRIVRLYNDIGLAYASLNEHDSADYYYHQALLQNKKWNGTAKNVQAGLTYKYLGDEMIAANNPEMAVENYQKAIVQFCNRFDDNDVFKNPGQFTGVFSYINLFNALTAKADALHLLYYRQNNIKFPEASLNTYHTAFELAGYVERTYDSDEARLFLTKIKYSAHSKPISISIQLYELTGDKKFLEEAWFFDQQNKASILSLNMQQTEQLHKNNAGAGLLKQEQSIRSAITRLSLSGAAVTDSLRLQEIQTTVRDYEIELGKIQTKINNDPSYNNKEITGSVPLVKDIQKLLDTKTALLSYHLSEKELLVLVITGGQFDYFKIPAGPGFFALIDSFKHALQTAAGGQKKYEGLPYSAALYKLLIAPAQSKLAAADRLIIIPDDELNYLPFETLQDEKGYYLVEQFSVQYQYSASLLIKNDTRKKSDSLLAIAPFTISGYKDSAGNTFSSLPASKEEAAGLQGNVLIDSRATKKEFLQSASRFGIIHLATHASVNNEIPERSYITFYPSGVSDPLQYKLYAQEIYDMQLDSAKLIILSACETGTGQLIKGEGLMSLSRAFAYAGCANTITSLWKAQDKTTAFITGRLHIYLKKGLHIDKALQHAKIDLLKNDTIDPRFKTPPFWGHLLFIGNYEASSRSFGWWWTGIAILLSTSIYLALKRKGLT